MNVEELVELLNGAADDEAAVKMLNEARRRAARALSRIRRPQIAVGIVNSPVGRLLVGAGPRGVVLNHFVEGQSDIDSAIAQLRTEFDLVGNDGAVKVVGDEIRRYLAGDARALRQAADLSLAHTPFELRALRKLLSVPRGALISYRALGAAIGNPRGARAIGTAMHLNPVPIYVPCHRVISSDGGLGGYGGGLWRKIKLLRAEGFRLGQSATRIPESVLFGHRVTKIYCRSSCPAATRADGTRVLIFADAAHAREAGWRACKVCKPV